MKEERKTGVMDGDMKSIKEGERKSRVTSHGWKQWLHSADQP